MAESVAMPSKLDAAAPVLRETVNTIVNGQVVKVYKDEIEKHYINICMMTWVAYLSMVRRMARYGKADEGHKLTDKELAKLEQRIAKLYKEAADELTDTVKAYLSSSISETLP